MRVVEYPWTPQIIKTYHSAQEPEWGPWESEWVTVNTQVILKSVLNKISLCGGPSILRRYVLIEDIQRDSHVPPPLTDLDRQILWYVDPINTAAC
jgi:hypothetical protein